MASRNQRRRKREERVRQMFQPVPFEDHVTRRYNRRARSLAGMPRSLQNVLCAVMALSLLYAFVMLALGAWESHSFENSTDPQVVQERRLQAAKASIWKVSDAIEDVVLYAGTHGDGAAWANGMILVSPGAKLTESQVEAITVSVESQWPELTRENITLLWGWFNGNPGPGELGINMFREGVPDGEAP